MGSLASDLAELFVALLLSASPNRILLGGSVSLAGRPDRHGPQNAVSTATALLALPHVADRPPLDHLARLGDRAGPLGSIA